jgi:hypothetical protein
VERDIAVDNDSWCVISLAYLEKRDGKGGSGL